MEAPASAEALKLAGFDWTVVQEPVYTDNQELIKGYKANVRSSDGKVLGVVSDRYKVVQNTDAFSFTDELLGKGVRYETAGVMQEGGYAVLPLYGGYRKKGVVYSGVNPWERVYLQENRVG